MALSPGTAAPSFSLSTQHDIVVNSASLKGSYQLIYFYPKDDTPGCTKEACEFTAALPEFEKLECGIYAVSGDSVASHKKFAEKYQLKITLLSDPDYSLAKAFGVYEQKSMFGKKYFGITRSTFLINPAGEIAAVWNKVKVNGHVAAVSKKLAELRA